MNDFRNEVNSNMNNTLENTQAILDIAWCAKTDEEWNEIAEILDVMIWTVIDTQTLVARKLMEYED